MYPLDKTTKEGRLFWSLPKRSPKPVDFDPTNLTHASVVTSYACLQAKLFSITIPYDLPRSKEAKLAMAAKAKEFEVPAFVPNDQKASEIESAVDKEKAGKNQETKDLDNIEEEESS